MQKGDKDTFTAKALADKAHREYQEQRNALLENQDRWDAILAAVPEAAFVSASMFSNTVFLYVTGNKHDLAATVRAIRTHGMKPEFNHQPPKDDDIEYKALFQSGKFFVWLNFTSSVCKRVQVGVEHVEGDIPVYETKCDDTPAPEAVAAA